MQQTKFLKLIRLTQDTLLITLAFLMPVFFLPITSEFFEFNKYALLAVTTGLMLVLWVLRMIAEKRVFVVRSLWDLGLVTLFVSFLLSSFFSLDRNSSIFGSSGRWFPSLFSFVILVAFYYVVSSNLKEIKTAKQVLIGFIIGGTISSFVALIKYFGLSIGSAIYFQAPNFTLTGSSSTAALIGALAGAFSLFYVLNSKSSLHKILFLQALIINIITVVLVGGLAAWVAGIVSIIGVMALSSVESIKESRLQLIILAGVSVAFLAVLAVPQTRDVLLSTTYPREIALPARESQVVAFKALTDHPILGTGPSTFYMDYPMYKTLAMNATQYWNVRFDKPFSELFNLMSSLGIVGLVAVTLLGLKGFRMLILSRRVTDDTGVITLSSVAIVATAAYFLFTYATVLSSFVLFLFMALLASGMAFYNERKAAEKVYLGVSAFGESNDSMSILGEVASKKELLPFIVGTPLVVFTVFALFQFYKLYMGEYYMRKAVVAASANNGSLTYEMQGKAIQMNPRRPSYYNSYAQTSIALANGLASKGEDLSDAEVQAIQTLISQAIQSTKFATETLNPANVSNWETRAFVYRSLIGVATDAEQWAAGAYNNAIQLDPTNPRLRLDIGGLYYTQKDYLSAANYFRQATSLKPDYANAHYNFGYSLLELQSPADAAREFQIVQSLVPQDSEDYAKVTEDLEKAKGLAAQAGGDSQPTVAQLESSVPANAETTPQEELILTGEEQSLNSLPANSVNSSTQTPARR